jgi:hypothetical protein
VKWFIRQVSKCFLVKSTPQIVEIIDSVLDINGVADRSKLVHKILLPYILESIVNDRYSEISEVDIVSKKITNIFNTYIEST